MTWRSRTCPCASPSTAPDWSAPTARPTRAPSMSPSSASCRISWSWPPPTRRNSCIWSPPPRPMTPAPSLSAIRAATASAWTCRKRRAARNRQGPRRARGRQSRHPVARHATGGSAESRRLLAAQGVSTTVADARFAKPLDVELLRRLASTHEVLITVEEGSIGGFGSFVLQQLAEDGFLDKGLRVRAPWSCPMSSSTTTSRNALRPRGTRRQRHCRQGF